MTLPKEIYKKRVIVAPLNWGLGHATRSIPIIKRLIDQNNTVAIASDGPALELLKEEFPSLTFFSLPGYNITYYYASMTMNMIVQSPHILKTIKKERLRAREIAVEWEADILISDNRFGFRSPDTENIYITHQISIPARTKLQEFTASKVHQKIIHGFDICWVPDYKDQKSLAGKLSQTPIDIPIHYLGALSRFEKKEYRIEYNVTAVLSGPEPQRTILEEKVLRHFRNRKDRSCCLVRGAQGVKELKAVPPNVKVFDLLASKRLNEVINASDHIICRAGYTSIMDLVKLEKSATIIPTPGQHEQEYLAKRLDGKFGFSSVKQEDFK